MWFSAIKLALNAGSIYKKSKKQKCVADAQAAHAKKCKGELEYRKTFRGKTIRLKMKQF